MEGETRRQQLVEIPWTILLMMQTGAGGAGPAGEAEEQVK